MIWDELGELTAKQKQLVSVLEVAKLEAHLPYAGRFPGRPPENRIAICTRLRHEDGLQHGDHTHTAGSVGKRPNDPAALRMGAKGRRAE